MWLIIYIYDIIKMCMRTEINPDDEDTLIWHYMQVAYIQG